MKSSKSEEESEAACKAQERLQWLSGKTVKVHLFYYQNNNVPTEESFDATYEDCWPLGRAYFFVFRQGEKRRLVNTNRVAEISED